MPSRNNHLPSVTSSEAPADTGGRPRNLILSALPEDEFALVAPRLERVSLPLRFVVCDINKPIEHVYFPETCLASQLSVMRDGSGVETATIGFEGMTGLPLFLSGEDSVEHTFLQIGGDAYRMKAQDFLEVLGGSGIGSRTALAKVLGRYAQALFTMAAQTSGCNRVHTIRQRCARWLLQSHDRMGTDEFPLTQHFLAQMLGVRRATVTEAAGVLQEDGLIEYRYGKVKIRDRAGLESAVCECYYIIRHEFERLVGFDVRTANPLRGVDVTADNKSTAKEPHPTEEKDPDLTGDR